MLTDGSGKAGQQETRGIARERGYGSLVMCEDVLAELLIGV